VVSKSFQYASTKFRYLGISNEPRKKLQDKFTFTVQIIDKFQYCFRQQIHTVPPVNKYPVA
jgi:hypothetical protein